MLISENRQAIEQFAKRAHDDPQISAVVLQLMFDEGPGMSLDFYRKETFEDASSFGELVEKRCRREADAALRASTFRLLATPDEADRPLFVSPPLRYQMAHGTDVPRFDGAATPAGLLRTASAQWELAAFTGSTVLQRVAGLIAPPSVARDDSRLDALRGEVLDQLLANADESSQREEKIKEIDAEITDRQQIADRLAPHIPILAQGIAHNVTDGRVPKPTAAEVKAAMLDVEGAMRTGADNAIARSKGEEPLTNEERRKVFKVKFTDWILCHSDALVAGLAGDDEDTDRGLEKFEELSNLVIEWDPADDLRPTVAAWTSENMPGGFGAEEMKAIVGEKAMLQLMQILQEG